MRWLNKFSLLFLTGLLVMACDQFVYGQSAKAEPIRGVPTATNSQRFGTTYRQQGGGPGISSYWVPSTGQQNGIPVRPGYAPGGTTYYPNQAGNKLQSTIDTKIRQYSSTTDNKQKKTLEEQVRALLSDQFDERLKEPQRRAESSRKRLDELTAQIKSRTDKADEIIDLRLRVLTHEALGLGWGTGQHQWPTASETIYVPYGALPNAYMPVQRTGNVLGPRRPARTPRPLNPGTYPSNQRPQLHSNVTQPGATTQAPIASGQRQTKQGGNRQGQALPKDDKPSIHQLLRDYKTAASLIDRELIEKELRPLLEHEFKNYQNQLSNSADHIEKQISKLEDNLAERKKMKESIVDLKLKTVINHANGLGF